MIDYSSISTKSTTGKLREHICNTRACIVALVLALVAVAGFLSATWYLNSVQFPQAEPTLDLMDYFVRVEGGRFVVGPECSLMYISGWNQWETVEAAAGVLRLYGASLPPNITGQELIKRKLKTAKEVGFNVVRAWANPV
jgi:mannan endo-1,4-beta-mannosidase